MPVAETIKRIGRPVLRLVGLRPPDYKGRVHHGKVAMDNGEIHGLVRAVGMLDRAPERIVEIGSYCGGSTVVIATAARRRNPAVRVFAVDPFQSDGSRYVTGYEALFDRNVAEWGVGDTITKLRTTSLEASVDWKDPIDFLFVDGDHEYDAVVTDIRAFVPFVREGGIVAFHDYKHGKPGVPRAVDALVAPHHPKVMQAGSLAVFRKERAS
jgi:predicted O-methyltransferase YrrM